MALVAVAAVTIIAVVSIGLLWPTSDSSSTSTRTVQSTTAAELIVPDRRSRTQGRPPAGQPTPAIVRSANAAEQPVPLATPTVQSANAAEQGL